MGVCVCVYCGASLPPLLRADRVPGVIRVNGVKQLLQFLLVQGAIGEEAQKLVQRQFPIVCRTDTESRRED